ncbi:leucinerich repeat kinase [Pelomyxa schiedti]|nr:leucinerich repeat kinase [Pelomyxa schiedti]
MMGFLQVMRIIEACIISGVFLLSPSLLFDPQQDFGGQATFLPTHQFFLTGRALYLVVYDLQNPNFARNEYWIRQILHTSRSGPVPPVILVGTRADRLASLEQASQISEAVTTQLRCICKSMVASVVVSGKDGDLSPLEDAILRATSQKQSVLCPMVPTGYILLDELIQEKKKSLPYVNWTVFSQWASEPSVDLGSEHLKEVTSFLHSVGSIVHYDSNSSQLGDYVVLQPKFLADLMSTTVTFKTNIGSGFLGRETLTQLWQHYNAETHPMLIELLSLFLVLLPICINRKEGFLVPCALPEKPPPEAETFGTATEYQTYKKYDRIYSFPGLPIGLFGRLLVRIMHLPNITNFLFWRDNLQIEVLPEGDARKQLGSVVFDSAAGLTQFLIISVKLPPHAKPYLMSKVLLCVDTTIECFYKGLQVDLHQFVTCTHCPEPSANSPLAHQFPLEEVFSALTNKTTLLCPVEKINVRPHLLAPDLMIPNCNQISEQEIQDLIPIGQGGFGKIYKGIWDGKEVAVKEMLVGSDEETGLEKFNEFQREVELMSMLNSPYIVKLFGISSPSTIGKMPMMVMEFVTMGDLMKVLQKKSVTPEVSTSMPLGDGLNQYPEEDPTYLFKMSWRLRLLLALDIAKGLSYLHSLHPPVIHRDLRSPNIFIKTLDPEAPVRAKVADFGLSITAAGGVKGNLNTWQWLAPEVIDSDTEKYDCQSDIFSLGIVIFEILTRSFPYDEYATRDLYTVTVGGNKEWRIQTVKQAIITDNLRPTIPPTLNCPRLLRPFVESCWRKIPSERPTASHSVTFLQKVLGISEPLVTATAAELLPLPSEIPLLWKKEPSFKVTASVMSDQGGTTSFIGCNDGAVRQLSANGDIVELASGPTKYTKIYCVLCVGAELWVGANGGRISVYDALTLQFKTEITVHGDSHFTTHLIAIYDNSNLTAVWSVSSTEETVVSVNPQEKEVMNKVYLGEKTQIGCLCQHSNFVWVGCFHKIIIMNSNTMQTYRILTRGVPIHKHGCVIISEDTIWFGTHNSIRVYDANFLNCTQTLIGHQGEVTSFCRALGYIWSSDSEGVIFAWNSRSFTPAHKISLPGVFITSLFSFSHLLVYSAMFPTGQVGAYSLPKSPAKPPSTPPQPMRWSTPTKTKKH